MANRMIEPNGHEDFVPQIYVDWYRGYEEIDFKKPLMYFNIGRRGAGKSALLEWLGARYLHDNPNCVVFDLYGAKDSESVAWCRSPWKDKILLIHGDSVQLACDYDTMPISAIERSSLDKFAEYRLVITVPRFFGTREEKFEALDRLSRVLEWRGHYKEPWFICIREAANWIASRYTSAKNQHIARADFIELCREARHQGYAIGLDALKPTSVEIDARTLADYTFIKKLGKDGLRFSGELLWLYKYIKPASLANFEPEKAVVVSDSGAWGLAKTNYVPWHKETYEDILSIVGIEIQYGDVPVYSKAGSKKIGDFQHVEIIKAFNKSPTLGKEKVGEQLETSKTTVRRHIRAHNREVKTKGFCLRCRRAKSEYQNKISRE